jgi:hypothetical protein
MPPISAKMTSAWKYLFNKPIRWNSTGLLCMTTKLPNRVKATYCHGSYEDEDEHPSFILLKQGKKISSKHVEYCYWRQNWHRVPRKTQSKV